MKTIFLLLTLMFGLNTMALECNIGAAVDGTGALKAGSESKCFDYFLNSNGAVLAAGRVVCLDLSDDNGAGIVYCPAAAAGVPVGIVAPLNGASCADGAQCRVQVYGLNSAVAFDSTNAGATAGLSAYISESTSGYIEAEATGSVAATDHPIGVFYDSPNASGDIELFIKLR